MGSQANNLNDTVPDRHLEWVFEGPDAARDAVLRRKQVRAHVTRAQHRRMRQREASGQIARLSKANPPRQRQQQLLKFKPTTVAQEQVSIFDIAGSVLAKSHSQGALAFRTFALNDPTNIVGRCLKYLDRDIASVLTCYEFIVGLQSQDFEQHYACDTVVATQPGSTSRRFLAFIHSDPVCLVAAILVTVRHLLGPPGPATHISPAAMIHVFHLRGFLVRCINSALDDSVRGISDQMLVAVSLLAAYEVNYGTHEGYHIHSRGLVQMINLRGGLSEIGSQDPVLERYLVWHDANASALAGCEGYYKQIKKASRVLRPKADANMFQVKQEAN